MIAGENDRAAPQRFAKAALKCGAEAKIKIAANHVFAETEQMIAERMELIREFLGQWDAYGAPSPSDSFGPDLRWMFPLPLAVRRDERRCRWPAQAWP